VSDAANISSPEHTGLNTALRNAAGNRAKKQQHLDIKNMKWLDCPKAFPCQNYRFHFLFTSIKKA
jgi:hypothetical protein